ncbi:MAG: uroporphyrinogen-III synthase [Bacteroidia bacterium]|nr:uroporphyrinogen-III synthase [Bacteroidia bacterium]
MAVKSKKGAKKSKPSQKKAPVKALKQSSKSKKKKPVSPPKNKVSEKKTTAKPLAKKVAAVKAPKKIVEKKETPPPVVVKKQASPSPKKEVKVAPPVIEQKPIIVSNHPKLRVKTVLVSQPRPESEKSPYLELARKYNLKMDFRQFISIEGVPAKDFRMQRVGILEHNAVILTSRIAIDHYFRMANEMRVTIPETMKYFCLSESIAYYLQKYVQYRKRKIFFGHQTIADLVDVLKKHKEEKFLLPVSDVHREQIVEFLDEMNVKYTKATFYKTVSADLSDMNGVLDYDIVVFFTSAGIKSLKKNFPNLVQGNVRIGAFGYNTAQTVQELGYRLDIHSPTPQAPSMTMALEHYLRESNKR